MQPDDTIKNKQASNSPDVGSGALRDARGPLRPSAPHAPKAPDERLRALQEIARRFDELPVLDDREPDEIIGYDEDGLPS
jgi:hypothetical protein